MTQHYYIGDRRLVARPLDEDFGEAELAGAVPTMRAKWRALQDDKLQHKFKNGDQCRTPDEADRAGGGGDGHGAPKWDHLQSGHHASGDDVSDCGEERLQPAARDAAPSDRWTDLCSECSEAAGTEPAVAVASHRGDDEDHLQSGHHASGDDVPDCGEVMLQPAARDAAPSDRWADLCSECSEEEAGNEPTGAAASHRGDDDASPERVAEHADGRSAHDPQTLQRTTKPRRRRRRLKDIEGIEKSGSVSPDAPAASASASSSAAVEAPSASSQSPKTSVESGFRLIRAPLDYAEAGDYDSALGALVQLLLCEEERTPRTQLFDVTYQKNRSGWRATISLATGRQIFGPVRKSQRAARAAAMESAMDYLVRVGLHISTSLARRLSPRA